MRRVLRYSVGRFDADGHREVFPAGTPESKVPDEIRESLSERKWAVERDDATDDVEDDEEIPEDLDLCSTDQLFEIAELHGVELGRIRAREKVIAILREAGIGAKETP